VNDAEQGLIEAARRLRRALNCCVRYVHHTGKGNARERTLDQYTGRGGSAFADGARMVHVLQPLAPADWLKATGTELAPGENGLILARPKMSYCPPQTDIYLRRRGYLFEHVEATENGPAATVTRNADTIWSTLEAEYLAGRLHTQNSLQSLGTGLTRPEVRDTVHWLEAAGRIERRARPGTVARGAREYLHPVAAPDSDGAPNPKTPDSPDRCADEKSGLAGAPPLGKEETAHREAPFSSPVSLATPEQPGAPRAQRAHRGNRDWEGEL